VAIKVAFTGTQTGMTEYQENKFREYLLFVRPNVLIHGGCIGADCQADNIAWELGIAREIYPSNIHKKQGLFCRLGQFYVHDPMNPLTRNKFMVERCDLLIAAPHQGTEVVRSGTWATVRYGRKKLGPEDVWIITPEDRTKTS
jgi:hypothetical protein